jgi:hypothetical protein
VTGRKVKGNCVAQTKKNRNKPRCPRTTVAATFTLAGHSGANTVRFAGRVSSSVKLSPGTYVLEITAVNAEGKAAVPQTLTFTIVK